MQEKFETMETTLKTSHTARTQAPYSHPDDAQPTILFADDPATYHLPKALSGLPVQIKERDLSDCGKDESGGKTMQVAALLAPKTERQLATILRKFSSVARPLTIAGAQTGLSRGAVPPKDGQELLSMRSFLQVPKRGSEWVPYFIDRDKEDRPFAVVSPGVPLLDFQNFVESSNLYYPPDPTERSASMGGTVATNASGPRTFKYGPTRDWVRAMRVMLVNGEILALRRGQFQASALGQFEIQEIDPHTKITVSIPKYAMPPVKNVAGYYAKPGMDLIDLFIGSEGTLGIVTEIEVALIPRPGHRYSGNVYFPTEAKARTFAAKAREISLETRKNKTAAVDASLLEYFDIASVHIIREKCACIHADARAAIYFEQEITSPATPSLDQDPLVNEWRRLMDEHGALDIQEAFHDTQREVLRQQRHSVPEEINRRIAKFNMEYPDAEMGKVATDIAVPGNKFEEMMQYYEQVLTKSQIPFAAWGHIGDHHIHVNMIPHNPDQHKLAKKKLSEFAAKAKELGGTITAEHGTGKLKIAQLEILFGPEALREMASVKLALDAQQILGVGNLFRKEIATIQVHGEIRGHNPI
jgi:D-lactate dehydrogenase (cytochrome)